MTDWAARVAKAKEEHEAEIAELKSERARLVAAYLEEDLRLLAGASRLTRGPRPPGRIVTPTGVGILETRGSASG